MPVTATVTGLDRLTAKLARIPLSVQGAAKEANHQNALEFAAGVARIVPVDDDAGMHLASTLKVEPGKNPLAWRVSIGGPEAPYPAHLEYGHMTPGGHHVPAKPFWWTTWRVLKRRFKSRSARAANTAIKKAAS